MDNKGPNDTLRIRGMNLYLYILRTIEDTLLGSNSKCEIEFLVMGTLMRGSSVIIALLSCENG